MAGSIPVSDSQFNDWMLNFATVASDNAASLDLTVTQAAELDAAAASYSTAYAASEAAKNAQHGAVATKNDERAAAEALARTYVAFFSNNPDVDKALLAELGINVTPGSIGPVTIPTTLSAVGYSNGQNQLTWNRNGNSSSTSFIIEAMPGTSTTWTQIGTTTKSKWTHTGQTPGDMVTYRVYAMRGDSTSGYSNEAVVYPNSDATTLSFAA